MSTGSPPSTAYLNQTTRFFDRRHHNTRPPGIHNNKSEVLLSKVNPYVNDGHRMPTAGINQKSSGILPSYSISKALSSSRSKDLNVPNIKNLKPLIGVVNISQAPKGFSPDALDAL